MSLDITPTSSSVISPLKSPHEGMITGKTTKLSLQSVLEQWRAIDLDGKRNELDKQATDIAENKDSSVASRKKLAEQTKQFRKYTDAEKINAFGNLLKLYQEEIDKLTKRSKFAETSFFFIYQLISEAPDPTIGLAAALSETGQSSKVSELEIENKKLKTELEEFRKEFQEVKDQEVTIRRLEEKIGEYESKIQDIVDERIKTSEKMLKDEQEKTIETLREREQDLKRQVAHATEELTRVQRTLDLTQNELMDIKLKFDEKHNSNQGELDMVVEELERTRTRVLALEREREKYLEGDFKVNQLSNISSNTADLELEIAQKDIEISQLKEHIQKLEQQLFGKTNTLKLEVTSLSEELQKERAKVKQMTEELKTRPSIQEYSDIKNQLEVLRKALEYNVGVEEGSEQKTVEALLKEKIKKSETEIVTLRLQVTDLEEQLKDTRQKLTVSIESGTESKSLIAKLEEDLAKANQNNQKSVEEMFLQKGGLKSEDHNMLQIVINQRDRFKARILELESENKELHHRQERTNAEIESLKQDNISLYEKIKYLQSYGTLNQGDRAKALDMEANQLDARYSKLYEESINPFEVFNRKEKFRRYKELNAAEKVILNGGRMLLSTKSSRTFLFIYSISLHILVFLTLYKYSSLTAEAHTSGCCPCPPT